MKPEKQVEAEVKIWAARHGWFLTVIDSKATYSTASGGYKKSKSAVEGAPDLIGTDCYGQAVFIELKAPGKESVCRLKQMEFLRKAIDCGAFAVVVSSAEDLKKYHRTWMNMGNEQEAREYLVSLLPKKVLVGGKRVAVTV